MNRQMLSVADVATLAAGVVNGVTVVAPAPAAAPEKQAEQETTTIEAMAAEVIKPVEMSAVDLLKEQLETEKVAAKEATAKFTAAETARLAAEAKTAEADVTANTLKGIAAAAVNNMLVALGRGTEDLTKSSATDIAGRHAAVHADFTKNFPVGGVTGSAVAEENKTTKTSRNSLSAAQVAAVGFAD